MTSENYLKALQAVKDGKVTVDQIEAKYILNDKVKDSLINITKNQ